MNIFTNDCPYCGAGSVAFTILHEKCYVNGLWDTFATCGYCGRGIVATFECPYRSSPSESPDDQLRLLSIAPELPSSVAPIHTPKNAARLFEQAMDNLSRNNWDAAGGMFRKALEVGLKSKFPDMKDTLSLNDRIEEAAKKHELTPALAEWSHKIQFDGNDAMHEEELFSANQAKDLAPFTKLVFQYLFMLPGMLSEARNNETEAGKD